MAAGVAAGFGIRMGNVHVTTMNRCRECGRTFRDRSTVKFCSRCYERIYEELIKQGVIQNNGKELAGATNG